MIRLAKVVRFGDSTTSSTTAREKDLSFSAVDVLPSEYE